MSKVIIKGNSNVKISLSSIKNSRVESADLSSLNRARNIFLGHVLIGNIFDDSFELESISWAADMAFKEKKELPRTISYHFNVRKSYIATTKKEFVDRCKEFYARLKGDEKSHGPIVDASKETNLKDELGLNFSASDKPMPIHIDTEFNPNGAERIKEKEETIGRVSSEELEAIKQSLGGMPDTVNNSRPKIRERKKAGYASLIFLTGVGIIGTAALAVIVGMTIVKLYG